MKIRGNDVFLPVAGVGSWPRPRWLTGLVLGTAHEPDFPSYDIRERFTDAVALCVGEQERLGFDVISDGSQYYESGTPGDYTMAFQFLPSRIGGTVPYGPPVPIPGLQHFNTVTVVDELRWVRPVFGPIMEIVAKMTDKPKKLTVPSPAFQPLALHDTYYGDPGALARALADVINAELKYLVANGLVDIVQFFAAFVAYAANPALSAELFKRATDGVDADIWDHQCQGNAGDRFYVEGSTGFLFPEIYDAETDLLHLALGHALRAPDLELLVKHEPPARLNIGVGVIDVKDPSPESLDEVVNRIERALGVVDPNRVALMPDCGWMNRRRDTVWEKCSVLVQAAQQVRERYR